MPNRLATETSPYLLQHADNPVDWWPWCDEARALARDQDKPILLSIGYSACHWCHVMAHESFEDADTAAVMNRLFVNIKVDREERPDLDQIYQSAHQMLARRAGGWPLTMFLAPDGTPFFGGTYFPKAARYGLPAFVSLLERVAGAFAEQRGAIEEQNAAMRAALERSGNTGATHSSSFNAEPIGALCELLDGSFDSRFGGFGGAPKFPHPTDIEFLLRRFAANGDGRAREMAVSTLQCMADGGIYDHLGGGFSRYSVDERWEIPHFEKMLYDNGPLLALYADAWALTGEADFRRVATETADWAVREMQSPEGGYFSSFDADSEGEEGRFYVWQREQIKAVLDAQQWRLLSAHYGLDRPPNFEGQAWHLHVARPLAEVAEGLGLDADEARLVVDAARRQLFELRAQRVAPARDDKVLVSWNALMVKGMARAARVFGRGDWFVSACKAVDFIRSNLWQDEILLASWKDGRARFNAYLDDHAFLLDALLEMLQSDYRAQDLEFAEDLADALLERFEDRPEGGFFFTSHDHEALLQRPKSAHDSAMPAGNGTAAFALQRLGHLTGEKRYLDSAEHCLQAFYAGMRAQPGGKAAMLAALEEWLEPPRMVLLRGPDDEVRTWQRALARKYLPSTLVLALPDGLAGLPPLLSRPQTIEVNAWLCSGVTCMPPIDSFDALERALGR